MPPQEYSVEPPPYRGQETNNDTQVVNNDTEMTAEGCGQKITNAINGFLERVFARLGFVVATHAWKTILISLLITGLCFLGIFEYQVESRDEKLWVPQSVDNIKHKDWVEATFPTNYRPTSIMLEKIEGNILTAEGLANLYWVYEKVKEVENGTSGTQWEDICYRLSGLCVPNSILELWHYDISRISNLTDQEILDAVNQGDILMSPMTNKPLSTALMVGGPAVISNNTIVSASVLSLDIQIEDGGVYQKSEGMKVDEKGERWEESFEGIMSGLSLPGYKITSQIGGRRTKAALDASNGDLQFFVIGYLLVIIYLQIMLGTFSRLGHKIYLAFMGIAVIGMSIGVAYGLGSAFQFRKTPVHDVLAFLLLGIGVDDVFVIVQNWENIGGPKPDGRSVPEKVSLTLKHAGVSILVTSLTDVCAFLIGASTILPALRSFCIWCGIGILAVFALTITFFTACLAIDAKRQLKKRDACLCCMTLSDSWEPMKCSKKGYLQVFLRNVYGPVLMSVPGKVIALLAVAGLLAGGGYGLSGLKQDFDYNWFLPESTAPRQYTTNVKVFFPSNGEEAAIYIGKINYMDEYAAIGKIKSELESNPTVANGTIHSWYHQYHEWLDLSPYQNELNRTKECNESVIACKLPTEERFYELLPVFLNDSLGAFYENNIKFSADGKYVQASFITFSHTLFNDAAEEIDAMESVQDKIKPGLIASEMNSLLPFSYTFMYLGYETNKAISKELFRNVLLATAVVFVVTLFLLSNIWASLMVVACVAFALVDITGFMHFWGLTIDTVTTIIIVLAIGLTVDYSAHIAHGFLVSRKGSKNERMIDALAEIGPAVVHGGVSTLLAFLLLAASESYVFFTFFKVFFLVVLFGMFHGMVFLPVILSLLGPAPYAAHGDKNEENSSRSGMPMKAHVQPEKQAEPDQTWKASVEDPKLNNGYARD